MKEFFKESSTGICAGFSLMIFVLFLYGMEQITIQNIKIARLETIIKEEQQANVLVRKNLWWCGKDDD